MRLFSFASKNVQNIQIGIESQMWAVATLSNQRSMAARVTKALKYVRAGDLGLLYCNPEHTFTTPFLFESTPDPDNLATDIWPEAWSLPFKIRTLGDLSRKIEGKLATDTWPFLRQRLAANDRMKSVSAAMNLTGTTVFVPVKISKDDWNAICEDLATGA